MTRILSREGVRPRVSEFFFKYVVQRDVAIWCGDVYDYPHMGQFLGGFQYQVAR